MANPFGGADETLTKNTGHTNQANLVYAMIPRTANKWREVVTAADVTPSASGNYDSDGYWRAPSTGFETAAFTIGSPLNTGTARTLIVGVRYNSAGGGGGGIPHAGLYHDTNYTSNSRFFLRMDVYSRQYQAHIHDGAGNAVSGLTSAQYNPGVDTSAAFIRGNSSTPAQDAFYRVAGSNTAMGTGATATISQSDAALNRIGVRTTNKWAVQYIFAYDAVLSDADINAIIDDPASVVGAGAAANQVVKVERGRGVGRGLGRGIF